MGFGGLVVIKCCAGLVSFDSVTLSANSAAAIALAINFDDRRANLAEQGNDFSAHLEHGTLLSQPVFALAQLRQAMGVRPAIVGTEAGRGREGSLISWYVE